MHGAARGACQTPAGHSRSSLRSGRARVRSVWPRPALGALGSPRGAHAARAGAPGRPDRARSVARAAAVETEDSHRAAGPRPS